MDAKTGKPKENRKFVKWLQEELDKRHWTRSNLARSGGMHPSTLTNIYNGKRNAGGVMLHRIAKGLDLPDEVVFHAYGMIAKEQNTDDTITEILHELGGFNQPDKEEILEFVLMKRRIAEKNGTYKTNK